MPAQTLSAGANPVQSTGSNPVPSGGTTAGLALALAGHLYDVSLEDLRAATRRGAKTAIARHIAMYLLHVVHRLSLAEIGREFGRDRSTASHACHRIEDLRDDPGFDRQIARLEHLLREAAAFEAAP